MAHWPLLLPVLVIAVLLVIVGVQAREIDRLHESLENIIRRKQ